MAQDLKYNIVIGGGITGLFSAHTLQTRFPNVPVLLIESAPQVGGLLKSKYYGKHGAFDHGIHAFYETGISEIDEFFLGLPINWKFLTDYDRDLGGAGWKQDVNFDAPFLDVRKSPRLPQYISEIQLQISEGENGDNCPSNASAREWSNKRFGRSLTEDFIAPAIEARQHQNADDVHWLAANIQGLSRIVMCDEDEVLQNFKNDQFSSRIGFPNQRTYPKDILSGKRTYYPHTFGMGNVIDCIAKDLMNRGVTILTHAKLVKSLANGDQISHVVVSVDNVDTTYAANRVVCAAPIPALLFTLENKPAPQPFNPPHQTVICNLLSCTRPRDEGLYYIFFHGHERMHRVSFPYNYSSDDTDKRGFAMCVECVYPRGDDASDATDMCIKGLIDHGIVEDPDDITFSDSYVSAGGYPNLSVGNIKALGVYRDFVEQSGITNIDSVGILAREDLFFQFDLIKHVNEVLV